MSKDGNLGSFFLRDWKRSLIVVSPFLKDRHLGSNFLRDSKESLIVVSTFLKDRKLGSFFLRDSKGSLIVVSHFPEINAPSSLGKNFCFWIKSGDECFLHKPLWSYFVQLLKGINPWSKNEKYQAWISLVQDQRNPWSTYRSSTYQISFMLVHLLKWNNVKR